MRRDEKNEEGSVFLFFEFFYGGANKCSVLNCNDDSFLHTQLRLRTQELVTIHTVNSFLCEHHLLKLMAILEDESMIGNSELRSKETPFSYLEEGFLVKILEGKDKIQTSIEYFYAGKHRCSSPDCKNEGFVGMRVIMRVGGKTSASFNIPICGKCFLKVVNSVKEEKDHWERFNWHIRSSPVNSNYRQ